MTGGTHPLPRRLDLRAGDLVVRLALRAVVDDQRHPAGLRLGNVGEADLRAGPE